MVGFFLHKRLGLNSDIFSLVAKSDIQNMFCVRLRLAGAVFNSFHNISIAWFLVLPETSITTLSVPKLPSIIVLIICSVSVFE